MKRAKYVWGFEPDKLDIKRATYFSKDSWGFEPAAVYNLEMKWAHYFEMLNQNRTCKAFLGFCEILKQIEQNNFINFFLRIYTI